MKKPDYTVKVDALLDRCGSLGFDESDFADLAIAALDQAGASVEFQADVRLHLNLKLSERGLRRAS